VSAAQCVICSAVTADAGDWTPWTLPEPIHWRSAFSHDGEEPPHPAGRFHACPKCTAWIPRHRAGNMPPALQEGIHALVSSQEMHRQTRRQLHAELVGRMRHLAGLLQPVAEGVADDPDEAPE
jgi:hypothetical protein